MRKNRFILAMLAVALTFGALLAGCGGGKPNQASDFNEEGAESDGTISSYNGKLKNVVIPAEVDGEPVTAVAAYAFADNTGITSVVIPEGVTDIGDFAFANCAALKSVTLPASLKTIGDGAFLHCARLAAAATLSAAPDNEGLPVLDRLGDFAFGGCIRLDAKTRAALAELGVTDFALGKPPLNGDASGFEKAARYNPDLRLAVPYANLLSMMGISYNIVARNLFAQSALSRGDEVEARLVGASLNGGTFTGVIGLFSGDVRQQELTIALQSGTGGYNYPVYVEIANPKTGAKQTGRWDDVPEVSGNDYFSAGQAIGKAVGLLFVPITEQGFYNVRRLADKTNPGVLSPAALAKK